VIVVLAEKPSVARDLAAVLGAKSRCNGFFEGNGYWVTWAIGHLVGIAPPEQMRPEWKPWSRTTLPMVPDAFPLTLREHGRGQYRVVERLLRARDTEGVIAATDAGREGELIFRYIYELAHCSKPVQRLWLSSMTPDAIRAALANLASASQYDGLATAARARSQADWLVGMNLSRAYTLTHGTLCSVGRVQTPTLAMIVERDRAILEFVPQPYLEVEATFESAAGAYRGTYYAPPSEGLRDNKGRLRAFLPVCARLPADGQVAAAIAQRARTGQARVHAVEQSFRRTPPPQLYDLTELQRHANRLYGLTAQRTLDAAQALYETHKSLSYPRTDSRYLSSTVASTLPAIVDIIGSRYGDLVAANSGCALTSRWVDDAKVSEHHALIPTNHPPSSLAPESAEARIYDLVCRRLLMAWHGELAEAVTRLVTEVSVAAGEENDVYASQGVAVEAPGWTVLEPNSPTARRSDTSDAPKVPAGLTQGAGQRVTDVVVHRKQTHPPKPHTEATLLGAMETAGRQIDEPTLREAMRESGLGTAATRAATIETLLHRGYIERHGNALRSSPTGRTLIAAVHPRVKSPEMTGEWEKRLRAMERGVEPLGAFMKDIAEFVRGVVAIEATKPTSAVPSGRSPTPGVRRVRARTRSRARTAARQTASSRLNK
jgi:DNA topoisomerase-3